MEKKFKIKELENQFNKIKTKKKKILQIIMFDNKVIKTGYLLKKNIFKYMIGILFC